MLLILRLVTTAPPPPPPPPPPLLPPLLLRLLLLYSSTCSCTCSWCLCCCCCCRLFWSEVIVELSQLVQEWPLILLARHPATQFTSLSELRCYPWICEPADQMLDWLYWRHIDVTLASYEYERPIFSCSQKQLVVGQQHGGSLRPRWPQCLSTLSSVYACLVSTFAWHELTFNSCLASLARRRGKVCQFMYIVLRALLFARMFVAQCISGAYGTLWCLYGQWAAQSGQITRDDWNGQMDQSFPSMKLLNDPTDTTESNLRFEGDTVVIGRGKFRFIYNYNLERCKP